MALFRFNWLRRLIRRNTRPIAHNTAETWRNRLSLTYMFLAWNAMGVVCYAIYNGKLDWAKYHGLKEENEHLTQAERFAHTLNAKNATIIRFSGGKKIEQFKVGERQNENTEENSENSPVVSERNEEPKAEKVY
ncbi:uncharacterized protein LOC132261520 [Phlebotomus argentipes]|uniref:uncharacterized protein LOC132261520 n=1 Tax=Phlebotomus argentipes TaxID=94469 RepID=UPI0028934D17|nr:uncharacterized protein LOC132261520 [Phlebotomus argentipes]